MKVITLTRWFTLVSSTLFLSLPLSLVPGPPLSDTRTVLASGKMVHTLPREPKRERDACVRGVFIVSLTHKPPLSLTHTHTHTHTAPSPHLHLLSLSLSLTLHHSSSLSPSLSLSLSLSPLLTLHEHVPVDASHQRDEEEAWVATSKTGDRRNSSSPTHPLPCRVRLDHHPHRTT